MNHEQKAIPVAFHKSDSLAIPICIILFDNNVELVVQEAAKRKNVFLFKNKRSIDKWKKFIDKLKKLYYDYPHEGVVKKRTEVLSMHRKYCAFDGSFDEVIYLDIDTLVLQSLEHVFSKLKEYDFVVHDFQRKTSIRLNEVSYFFEIFKEVYDSDIHLSSSNFSGNPGCIVVVGINADGNFCPQNCLNAIK